MRFLAVLSLLQGVYTLTVSEKFQLFNVNDISSNSKNKLASYPIGSNGDGDVLLGGSGSPLTLQIDYNGFVQVSENKYLNVDTDNNNKIVVTDEADKSHIFFITQHQLHFDQYFVFVACPKGSEYSLYVGNNINICDGGLLVNLRPVSTVSGNAVEQYVPDILRTSQGVAIAAGSSLSYVLTEGGATTTVNSPESRTSSSSTTSFSGSSSTKKTITTLKTEKVTTVIILEPTDLTTTVYAGQGSDIISVTKFYKLSTYLSTALVPVTSTYTSKDKNTVLVVTTVHTTLSESPCESTISTVYSMETKSNSHYSSLSIFTIPTNAFLSLSLLTTRTHNTTSSTSTNETQSHLVVTDSDSSDSTSGSASSTSGSTESTSSVESSFSGTGPLIVTTTLTTSSSLDSSNTSSNLSSTTRSLNNAGQNRLLLGSSIFGFLCLLLL